jgi:hypothetical protein
VLTSFIRIFILSVLCYNVIFQSNVIYLESWNFYFSDSFIMSPSDHGIFNGKKHKTLVRSETYFSPMRVSLELWCAGVKVRRLDEEGSSVPVYPTTISLHAEYDPKVEKG